MYTKGCRKCQRTKISFKNIPVISKKKSGRIVSPRSRRPCPCGAERSCSLNIISRYFFTGAVLSFFIGSAFFSSFFTGSAFFGSAAFFSAFFAATTLEAVPSE